MVTNVTSLTGNGLKDWLVQRVSALYFAGYTLAVLFFLMLHQPLDYAALHQLFACIYFKAASVLALVAFSLHAWIGLWTVTTDYLPQLALRLLVQMGILAWLSSQFVWAVLIFWRI